MIFTTTPTSKTESYVVAHGKTERVYTAIQYKGLNDNTIFDVDKALLKGEYDAKTHKFKTKYKNNDKDIELDEGFYNKYYCPLFTDFSYSNLAKAQDIETTWNALKTDNITMWWYSCTSARNAGNAGFRLNQNRGKIDSGKMFLLFQNDVNTWF